MKQESTKINNKLLQEMQKLNGSILALLEQNEQAKRQQHNQKKAGEIDSVLLAMKQLNKRGACDILKLPLIVIRYQEKHFTQEDIEKRYLAEIMTSIFVSIFRLDLKNEEVTQYSKLLEQGRKDILQKYTPIGKFPGIDRYVQDAYEIVKSSEDIA